jgi:AcrR family transcriptional regulator
VPPSAEARARSPKGEREAARILAAATTVLAREGFGGATLGRIAAEAGVDKKMVLYYFTGRETLLVEVVRQVGARVAANMTAALVQHSDVAQVAETLFDHMWAGTTEEPELPRAYLALATSSRESDEVRRALGELKASFERLFADQVTALEAHGYRLRVDRAGYLKLVMAMWRGLALEWTEEGDSPALQSALEQFKRAATAPFERV